MSLRSPLPNASLHPSHGVAALVRLLGDEGVAAEVALQGTGLGVDALADASVLTSVEQYVRVCSNAVEVLSDRSLAFRLGARLRATDCGIFGLLLLSCASLRDGLVLSVKYQQLAPLALPIEGGETGDTASWSLCDEFGESWPRDLAIFLTELQVAQHLAWVRELLGDDACRPALIRFAYPAPAHRDSYERHLGCPIVFDARRTEIHYPRALLTLRPCLANAQTARVLRSACEDLLEEIEASAGVAGKVYRTLLRMRNPGASMKAVASTLKMTDRTLRRRLADEGTSFTAISCQLRYGVATQYLKGSRASIEQIAAVTGFSDPSNFRRAFVRWTSMSPAQFRKLRHQ